ncbi:hypothetical protein [Lysobacter enzymogenes]|uniref:hypothetical protein n=1 Tax=Lysobacter enzymogenes TaxID=69 RepID=UPI001A96AD6A|nr:hypothetical protein [Lysobacter enzymogenes]QQP96521.1 hypothetical protein JHW38_00235 [Lysobacter enzymogenes]
MAKFFVGQRIKKTRGVAGIGVTGRLISFNASEDYDATAELDSGVTNQSGEPIPPGHEVWIHLEQWEPIIPEGAQPGECSFQELMDHLRSTTPESA